MTDILPVDHRQETSRLLDLGGGSHAEIDNHGSASRLRVFARDGALLVEYDAESGRMRLFAAADLRIDGARNVVLRAAASLQLTGATVGVSAGGLHVAVDEATLRARRTTTLAQHCKLVVDRLETTAKSVVARARDVYRTVENLLQTKAGRCRTLVDGAHHLQCGRSRMVAKGDFNVDGKRINLG